eukprot:2492529-Alexandrium_andersonii.AAC.1
MKGKLRAVDGPYVTDTHDFLFLWENISGCLWARSRPPPGQPFADPIVVIPYDVPDIFRDDLATDLFNR